jgi:hypothetical protein
MPTGGGAGAKVMPIYLGNLTGSLPSGMSSSLSSSASAATLTIVSCTCARWRRWRWQRGRQDGWKGRGVCVSVSSEWTTVAMHRTHRAPVYIHKEIRT